MRSKLIISPTPHIPLNDAQTYVPLAQETEQFSSKESVVGANPTRDAFEYNN